MRIGPPHDSQFRVDCRERELKPCKRRAARIYHRVCLHNHIFTSSYMGTDAIPF